MGITRWALGALLLAAAVLVPNAARADDCTFNTGANTFDYAQVMRCYRSLPFNPDDLANAVAFMGAARERSDLRETYQAQFGWREELAALASRSFDSDFDFQMALVDNHKKFYNPHWRYRRPTCYVDLLSAFMPFDFGSTVTRPKKGKPQQILFIESAAYAPDLYQSATGIDARRYVGLKVVSINGVAALAYFRAFGDDVLRFDTNDGENLNEVLQNAAYSLRTSGTHDVPPDRAFDRYVLETSDGRRVTVDMPWVFAQRAALGLGQRPMTASTAAFQALCLRRSAADQIAGSASVSAADLQAMSSAREAGEEDFVRELAEKRGLAARLRKKEGESNGIGYFEVAPGQRNLAMTTVVAPSHGASAYAIDDKATFLRLADFVQDWKAEVIAATDFACANSDRLVIDMRNNNGGATDQLDWLTAHLFPDRTEPQHYGLTGRYLNSNPGRNELAARMRDFMIDYVGDPQACWFGYEAACQVDPVTGDRFSDPDWYATPTFMETRGGQDEQLTRRVAFSEDRPEYVAGTNPIACPGKFQGKTLAVLTNGTGASAGYFFPEMIRDQAVFVSAGGYVGEPLVSGIARGGAVWGMNGFEAYYEQYFAKYVYGPATDPLPWLKRDVDSFMEQPGLYVRGQPTALYAEADSRGHTRIEAWADSPDTDGYVYRKVLTALQSY